MIMPGLEAETEPGELGEAFAELRVACQPRWHDAGGVFADRLARVPGHTIADAAKAPAGNGDLCLQHVAHARAKCEISVANDRLGDAAGTVIARSAHGGDAVDELDLADRRHFGRAVLAIHRLALEEDGRHDVVSAADVG